jgi:hypothetical protein
MAGNATVTDDLHNRVVRHVAATRFPFPDQTDWPETFVTVTNESTRQRGIPSPGGTMVYPDIVIVDSTNESESEIGEVEVEVNDDLVARWRLGAEASRVHPVSGARHFFVYVPAGQEERARDLLEHAGVPYGGVRAWVVADDGNIRIVPFVTPVDQKDHR